MDDTELTERLKQGDREAARELVRRHYASVLRFLSTLCPNPDDAEELAQETFVKTLQGIGKFRGGCGLRTWLHRMAFHEFTHRRRRQRPTLPLQESSIRTLFEANSTLALDLDHALACVPEGSRVAFVLCDVQELTMQEAAMVLGIPPGTVKSRLHTARKQLQALLEPEQEVNLNVSRAR